MERLRPRPAEAVAGSAEKARRLVGVVVVWAGAAAGVAALVGEEGVDEEVSPVASGGRLSRAIPARAGLESAKYLLLLRCAIDSITIANAPFARVSC